MNNPSTTGAVVDAVFNTNELLEAILSELDTADLVRCIRVCQHWRTVIEASVHMQQTLFLRPRQPTEYFTYLEGYYGRPRLVRVPSGNTTPVVKISPVFKRLYGCTSVLFSFAILRKANKHMLVTQPPCRIALITMNAGTKSVLLQNERGITVGMIKGLLEKYEMGKVHGRDNKRCTLMVLGSVRDEVMDVEMAKQEDKVQKLPHQGDDG